MINNKVQIDVPTAIIQNWQEIVNILAEMISVPASLIMRLDDPYIEVFVSSVSDKNPYHLGNKEKVHGSGLYCETVIKTREKLLIPNALKDAKWKDNPDIKQGMISYLGFPILLPDGKPFGTICILDNKQNAYSTNVEKLMLNFRNLIQSHLEVIYMNQVLGDKNKQLTDYLMELQALRGIVPICSNCKSIRDAQDKWHPIEDYLSKNPEAQFSHSFCPDCIKKLYPEYADEVLGRMDGKK
jgi:transcriptional regulator with GAF, ATPase, and Fis domain